MCKFNSTFTYVTTNQFYEQQFLNGLFYNVINIAVNYLGKKIPIRMFLQTQRILKQPVIRIVIL